MILWNAHGLILGVDAQFSGFESMLLGHGMLRAFQTIQDKLPEEWIAHLALKLHMKLSLAINQVQMIALRMPGDIDVFPKLDVSFRPQNKGSSVAPGAKAPGVSQSTRK